MHSMCTALTLQVASSAHVQPEQFFQTQQTISSHIFSSFNHLFIPWCCQWLYSIALYVFCVCNVNTLQPKNINNVLFVLQTIILKQKMLCVILEVLHISWWIKISDYGNNRSSVRTTKFCYGLSNFGYDWKIRSLYCGTIINILPA
jgi:hypothetical protein